MRLSCFLVVGSYLICSINSAAAEIRGSGINAPGLAAQPEQAEFFESKIRPILIEHCFKCHGPTKQEAGLRLDSREGILRGTDAGPVVVPGDPEASPLIEAIGYDAAIKMPPKSKLAPQVIADLTNWVRSGLPWPESSHGPGKDFANGRIARRSKTSLGVSAGCRSVLSQGQNDNMASDWRRSVHPRQARSSWSFTVASGRCAHSDTAGHL